MRNSAESLHSNIIFGCIIAMLVSLFTSRAALSITLIIFLCCAFFTRFSMRSIKQFIISPFLVSTTLLFLIPFISVLWSNNILEWLNIMRLKIPLLALPLAFAGDWQLSEKKWRQIAYTFLLLVFAGTCYSLNYYFQNVPAVHADYLKAKVIATPLQNDHLRFSLLVSIAVLLCLLLLNYLEHKGSKYILVILAAWFAVYLHVLAARTGILCLYIILILFSLHLLFQRRKPVIALIVISLVLILTVVSWFTLTTFQNRIKYFIYDHSFVRSGTYLPGATDGNRTLSLKAGWQTLLEHPFGLGAGDIRNKVNDWYETNVPLMLPTDKLYPSSEWLIYGLTAGWPAIFIFTTILIVPFFIKGIKYRFYWLTLHVLFGFSFLFDQGLEVQYGIFMYAFIILWWWKWLGRYPGTVEISDQKIVFRNSLS